MTSNQFTAARNISIETYRKNGDPVRTPVLVVEDGGQLYVRTDPRSGKVKRIRGNPRVRVAPSDMRGNPKGDWIEGEASFVEGAERERIIGLFKKKYGAMVRVFAVWLWITRVPPFAVIAIRMTPAGDRQSPVSAEA